MATATVQDEILREESQETDKPTMTNNEDSTGQKRPPDKEQGTNTNQTQHGLAPVQTSSPLEGILLTLAGGLAETMAMAKDSAKDPNISALQQKIKTFSANNIKGAIDKSSVNTVLQAQEFYIRGCLYLV